MASKLSTFVCNGWSSYKGLTFMRLPDVPPELIWSKIKSLPDKDKKSLITSLASVGHPAVPVLEKIYNVWKRYRSNPS